MACLSPLTAYRPNVRPGEKARLIFDTRKAVDAVRLSLPCGQCVECRLDYARQWSIRLMKEAACHEASSFLTLTYDDDNLPQSGSLIKEHVSAFHKRLHNRLLYSRGYGIRFYYCGEYGETYGRPHYHSIVFGFDFPDKKFYKKNSRGEPIYSSEFLRELWPFGLNGIGAVTSDSCAYVAGYVVDKVKISQLSPEEYKSYYSRLDAEGRFYEILPEFSGQSNRPGIGKLWFDRFKDETYRDDGLVVSGKFVRPPRYFDNLFKAIDADRLDELKFLRRKKSRGFSNRQSYAREKIVKARLKLRRKDVT